MHGRFNHGLNIVERYMFYVSSNKILTAVMPAPPLFPPPVYSCRHVYYLQYTPLNHKIVSVANLIERQDIAVLPLQVSQNTTVI